MHLIYAQCQEFSAKCLHDNLWGWKMLMSLFPLPRPGVIGGLTLLHGVSDLI